MRRFGAALAVLVLCWSISARAQTTAESSQEREFATFGIRFTPPSNWKRFPEDQQDMIAKWTIPSASAANGVMIVAGIQSAQGVSLKKYANDLAQQLQGEVRPETPGLGEDATLRIAVPAKGDRLPRAADVLLAVHNDYLYKISSYLLAADGNTNAALDEIRGGWSFVDLIRPTQCLGLRDDPIPFKDILTVKPPATLRPKNTDVKTSGNAVEMQIFNYRSGRADLVMTMEVDRRPDGKTLDQVGQALIAQMNLKQDPEHPITWKKLDSDREAVISTSFDGAKAGDRTVPIRFALVAVDPTHLLLFGFVFPTGDKQEIEIYEDLTEAMAKTVEPIKK